jgi:hypothetical protein
MLGLQNRMTTSKFTDKNNIVFLDVTSCNSVEMKRHFKRKLHGVASQKT